MIPVLPETHPLVEAVTKPLADNAEQRLAANHLLEQTLVPDHPRVEETLARFEKADSEKFAGKWRVALHVGAAFAICLMFFSVHSLRKGYGMISGISSMGTHHGYPTAAFPESLTPDQKLLLGDPQLSDLEQKQRLHLSDPDRPSFYAEYAGRYFQERSTLPEEYLETVSRIDPENAFFLYNAAGRNGGDSVEKLTSAGGSKAPPRFVDGRRLKPIPLETKWEVKDQEEFDRAMGLISRASRLSRLETYETSMTAERLALLDQNTFVERIRTLAFAASQTSPIIPIRKVADLFCAKAYLLSLAGKEEEFVALATELESFLGQLATNPDSSIVCELVYRVIASTTANSFHFAAKRLGLSELETKYDQRRKVFQENSDQKELREDSLGERIEKRSSLLNSLTLPLVGRQVANTPEVSPQDLVPGRMADHDLFSSALITLAVVLMGIASLVILSLRLRSSRSLASLARRFTLLLGLRDWFWILGCGVVLPVCMVLYLTSFTSLGGRDFGIRHNMFLFPTVHYVLIVLLVITLPILMTRWRLRKHLDPFGLRPKLRTVTLIVPVLGALTLLFAHPIIVSFSLDTVTLAALAVFPALWLIGICLGAGLILFGKPARRLSRAVPLAVLAPAYSLGIIILAAFQPYFRASADRWVARDDFSRVVPSGFSRFEAEVATEIRRETNAILGFE